MVETGDSHNRQWPPGTSDGAGVEGGESAILRSVLIQGLFRGGLRSTVWSVGRRCRTGGPFDDGIIGESFRDLLPESRPAPWRQW